MVYGKSPSTTAPVPPTGMSGTAAVAGCTLPVAGLGGGASVAFLVDFPKGDAATGFATGLATGTGCGGATGFGAAFAGAGVSTAAGIFANLISIIDTLCS